MTHVIPHFGQSGLTFYLNVELGSIFISLSTERIKKKKSIKSEVIFELCILIVVCVFATYFKRRIPL